MMRLWIAGLLRAVALGAMIINYNQDDDDDASDETEGQNLA